MLARTHGQPASPTRLGKELLVFAERLDQQLRLMRHVPYAAKFGAGPEWQHYTGTLAASVAAQKAFNVFREDKMDHNPVVLLRAAPGKDWLRIDGFATADELLDSFHMLVAAH